MLVWLQNQLAMEMAVESVPWVPVALCSWVCLSASALAVSYLRHGSSQNTEHSLEKTHESKDGSMP